MELTPGGSRGECPVIGAGIGCRCRNNSRLDKRPIEVAGDGARQKCQPACRRWRAADGETGVAPAMSQFVQLAVQFTTVMNADRVRKAPPRRVGEGGPERLVAQTPVGRLGKGLRPFDLLARGDDGLCHGSALGFVAVEKIGAGSTGAHQSQLSGQVVSVLEPGVHAMPPGGHAKMLRISCQQDASGAQAGGDLGLAVEAGRSRTDHVDRRSTLLNHSAAGRHSGRGGG
jgi:hypothetical protein